ncbi:DUF6900 domain-containing protein [Streptococcus sciuri]|uniref:DUF6900 domain-containing protein n=1 Tax=Streptococcus sciuri TaxID=2973939 RepID=A0ABT2F5J0_9STRE|nr:hypothetical protein [Streptococcus sciuri]MCS4487453.1 hypothetical protein [Streptococcus sciuri]
MEKCHINLDEDKQELDKVTLEEQIRLIFNAEDEALGVDEIITQIAQQVDRIPTLERQNLDSQDFHDSLAVA